MSSLSQDDTPVEGGVQDAAAPRAVRVGSSAFGIPVTVITEEPSDGVQVGLVYDEEFLVGYGFADTPEPGRTRLYKLPVELYAEDLVSWGAHEFVVNGFQDGGETLSAFATLPTEVKAHSLLGMDVSRDGAQVVVRGSARAYHSVQDRYVPWSGQAVSVQRWDGSAWLQVTGVRTDARGNLSTTVRVPAGTQLRLVLKDKATIWGAVSSATRV